MNAPTTTRPPAEPEAPRHVGAPSSPRPPRRTAGAFTLGGVMVVLGTLWLLATLDVRIPMHVVGPALLIVIGVGVVVSALRGERDGGAVGLIGFLGVVLAIGALATTVFDVPVGGGVGDRVHTPSAVEQVDDSYRLLAGTLTLDLREVDFPEGTTVVRVSTILGQARVQLPSDVAVSVDGLVIGGGADVLDHLTEGIGVSADRQTPDWDTAEQRVEIRGRVVFGELQVSRAEPGTR